MTEPRRRGTPVSAGSPSVRLAPPVYRELVTIQYARKMAGESWSLSEIIEQLLAERKDRAA